MKICKIYIKGFQQFQDVELDFTNPETGEPLDKVCFIGSNGTGKSTVLRLISALIVDFLNKDFPSIREWLSFENTPDCKILFQITNNSKTYFTYYFNNNIGLFKADETIISVNALANKILTVQNVQFFHDADWNVFTEGLLNGEFLNSFSFRDNSKDLLIYSPAESLKNGYNAIKDVPQTTVNESLYFSHNFPFYASVESDTVNVFWKILVYNLRKRAEERDAYENLPENLVKTKGQLIKEFDGISPKVLEHLNLVWDRILSKAGLYFDVKGASNPFQLSDNLKAYIKLKGKDKIILYNEISTGIRNFIFRVGHIFSLYFNREIDRGFLLVDEPENSLFPDFLFDFVEVYNQIIIDKRGQNNTQMFFATHNPIIAAQFQPYERIILDWNNDGTVSAKKGISPVGDDPNDILSNDFELKDLMGPEGRKMWENYVGLKKKLIRAKDDKEKSELIHDIEKIGSLYNFS